MGHVESLVIADFFFLFVTNQVDQSLMIMQHKLDVTPIVYLTISKTTVQKLVEILSEFLTNSQENNWSYELSDRKSKSYEKLSGKRLGSRLSLTIECFLDMEIFVDDKSPRSISIELSEDKARTLISVLQLK